MSNERIQGLHSFTCDTCNAHIDTEARDFNEALAGIKAAGWIAYPIAGMMWCHACPACKERGR